VFGKQVTLLTHGHDKYGRTIAEVLLPDGTNVNHELVKQGWCWWYRKYAPGNVVLEELERRARGAGLGLWAESASIPEGGRRKEKSSEGIGGGEFEPLTLSTLSPVRRPTSQSWVEAYCQDGLVGRRQFKNLHKHSRQSRSKTRNFRERPGH